MYAQVPIASEYALTHGARRETLIKSSYDCVSEGSCMQARVVGWHPEWDWRSSASLYQEQAGKHHQNGARKYPLGRGYLDAQALGSCVSREEAIQRESVVTHGASALVGVLNILVAQLFEHGRERQRRTSADRYLEWCPLLERHNRRCQRTPHVCGSQYRPQREDKARSGE
jgi:hypothetical protein